MQDPTIVSISHTRGLHRELDMPNGTSSSMILDFNDWLGELPRPFKIVVPSNLEVPLQSGSAKRKLISNAAVLINEGVKIMDLRKYRI